MSNKKRGLLLLIICSVLVATMIGCNQNNKDQEGLESSVDNETPTFKIGYIYTNHQTPLMMAAAKGDSFMEQGIYLKEVISKEKYVLMEDEKPIANLELVVNKSGSETMTMLAQGHCDIGLASNTAFITSKDQGNDVKILAPVHTEGIGLVVGVDSEIEGWEDFVNAVESGDKPYTVGYHSPTSAPLILFEAALQEAGISYSKNPEDVDASIMLMDLKGTGNLIPAMTSGQVQAWVGPSPYPELAVTEKVGKIALDMKHLPPEGQWYDFPCCVIGTTDRVASENSYEMEKIVELISKSADYCNEHMDEAAQVTSDFTGVSLDAAKLSTIKYTANPSEEWINNMGLTYNTLKDTGKISNQLMEDDFEEAKDKIFDFSFIEAVKNSK
ncbi:MAG: ABC transporter substrate-binding protein [Gudongella sp.]|nr:ABC transporter substrate-binding protein [Gudongella sp.]